MNPSQTILLYSRQPTLIQRLTAYSLSLAQVRVVQDASEFPSCLAQFDPAILVVDVFNPDCEHLVSRVADSRPRTVFIIIGEEKTLPMLSLQQQPIFAMESPSLSREKWQVLLKSAIRHQAALLHLEESAPGVKSGSDDGWCAGRPPSPELVTIRETIRSFASTPDLDGMLEKGLEWLRNYKGLGRVGVFLRDEKQGGYRFQRGYRCPREISGIVFHEHDLLVEWLKAYPVVLTAQQCKRPLRPAFKQFLSDVILPLYSSDGLLGWIFASGSVAGQSLENELFELGSIADSFALSVTQCREAEQREFRRVYFERFLERNTSGLLMLDEELRVRWLNEAASDIFEVSSEELLDEPVSRLGLAISGALNQQLDQGSAITRLPDIRRHDGKQIFLEFHSHPGEKPEGGGFLVARLASDHVSASVPESKALPTFFPRSSFERGGIAPKSF
jgi:PAS domain-containing protein